MANGKLINPKFSLLEFKECLNQHYPDFPDFYEGMNLPYSVEGYFELEYYFISQTGISLQEFERYLRLFKKCIPRLEELVKQKPTKCAISNWAMNLFYKVNFNGGDSDPNSLIFQELRAVVGMPKLVSVPNNYSVSKRELMNDAFDAYTDGQLGDFDDFKGNFDDLDTWSGR